MAFFRLVPNLTIMAPKDFKELEDMLEFAIFLEKPVVIRYPRGEESKEKLDNNLKIEFGKSEILSYGKDLTILAIGKEVSKAIQVKNELKEKGIEAEVINVRFLKPLDTSKIIESIIKTKYVVTIEDNTLIGGLASSVKELIIENELKDIKIKSFGYPDVFVEHGMTNELEEKYGVDVKNIVKIILQNFL